MVGNGVICSLVCVAVYRTSERHGAFAIALEYWSLRYSDDGLPQDEVST